MSAATAHPLVRSTNFAVASGDLRWSGRLRGGDRTVGALHPTARRLTPRPPVPSECLRSTHASIATGLSVAVGRDTSELQCRHWAARVAGGARPVPCVESRAGPPTVRSIDPSGDILPSRQLAQEPVARI